MKVFVTGGAGFIGSHLVDRLIKEGHKALVLDNFSTGKKKLLSSKVKTYNINLSSPQIFKVFKKEKPEIIYHLAGPINLRRKIEDPLFQASLNFFSDFKRLLDCSRDFKVKKFILISSGGALYPNTRIIPTPEDYSVCPDSLYGLANLILEKLLEGYYKDYGLNFAILRFSNIYGPRQWESGVIPSLITSILKRKTPLIYGDGRQTRDFLYIDDAIKSLLVAAKTKGTGIFHVGSGQEVSVNELFKKITKILKVPAKPICRPTPKVSVKRSALDSSKIKRELGWRPKYNLEEGLKKTIEWFAGRHFLK